MKVIGRLSRQHEEYFIFLKNILSWIMLLAIENLVNVAVKSWTNKIKIFTNLFNFAQLVDVPLVSLHAVFGQMEVGRVFGQLLLILGHFLDHGRQILHRLFVALRHAFRICKLLQVFGNALGNDGDMLVAEFYPEFVVFVQEDFFLNARGCFVSTEE